VNSQARLAGEVHRRARKGTVGQQLSPVYATDAVREIRVTAVDLGQCHERAV
jgi:hypothetical protein